MDKKKTVMDKALKKVNYIDQRYAVFANIIMMQKLDTDVRSYRKKI